MENRIDTTDNQNENEPIVRKKNSIKMRIWNTACILLFAVGIVFLIFFLDKYHHIIMLNYDWAIITSVAAAMFIIVCCFFGALKKIGAAKFAALIIAGIVLAANWYIYIRYIPKYGLRDACAIVNADPEYASATVEPQYFCPDKSLPDMKTSVTYEIKDNPFYAWGYILDVISDGKVTAWIAFDPATGKYELFYEPKDEYVQ